MKTILAMLLAAAVGIAADGPPALPVKLLSYAELYNRVSNGADITVNADGVECERIPGEPAGRYRCFMQNGKVMMRAVTVVKAATTPAVVSTWTDPQTGCRYQTMSDGTTYSYCPNRR